MVAAALQCAAEAYSELTRAGHSHNPCKTMHAVVLVVRDSEAIAARRALIDYNLVVALRRHVLRHLLRHVAAQMQQHYAVAWDHRSNSVFVRVDAFSLPHVSGDDVSARRHP